MSKDDLAARIARYRETAEALRGIGEQLRFVPRRGNQLCALADGFERFTMRLEGVTDMAYSVSLGSRDIGQPARLALTPALSANARQVKAPALVLPQNREPFSK